MIDIDTALREMTETEEAVADMVLSDRFRNELSRIRLDLGVSPYLPISDEMCKWVVLAYLRSDKECATPCLGRMAEENPITEYVERFASLVAAAEREACAKVCESLFDADDDSCNEAEKCADAIRARGNK